MNVTQKTHVLIRSELRDLASVIGIGEGVRPRSIPWVDYDGKVDIGVGRDPAALSSCFSPVFLFILICEGPHNVGCGGLPAAWYRIKSGRARLGQWDGQKGLDIHIFQRRPRLGSRVHVEWNEDLCFGAHAVILLP